MPVNDDDEDRDYQEWKRSREYRGASELSRRIAREFDLFRQASDKWREDFYRTAQSNIRWLGGIIVIIIMSTIGSYISSRVQLEQLSERQSSMIQVNERQDKTIEQLERRLRQIEQSFDGKRGPP